MIKKAKHFKAIIKILIIITVFCIIFLFGNKDIIYAEILKVGKNIELIKNKRDIRIIKTENVIIIYEENIEKIAKEIEGIYLKIKKELIDKFIWDIDFRPNIIIARDRKDFKKLVGSDVIIAFAIPERNIIVLDISRVYTKRFTLETTLKHELCHLLMHRNIKSIPRWLDEGVCQWSTGGIAELVSDRGEKYLSSAVVSNSVISIKQLKRFPNEQKPMILAYEESKSFVEYIVYEYGEQELLRMLEYMKEGKSFDASLERVLNIRFNDLEKNWLLSLKRRHTWVSYLSHNLYTIIFFLASILTFYGFLKLLKRKRKYKDEDQDGDNKINEGY